MNIDKVMGCRVLFDIIGEKVYYSLCLKKKNLIWFDMKFYKIIAKITTVCNFIYGLWISICETHAWFSSFRTSITKPNYTTYRLNQDSSCLLVKFKYWKYHPVDCEPRNQRLLIYIIMYITNVWLYSCLSALQLLQKKSMKKNVWDKSFNNSLGSLLYVTFCDCTCIK